MSASTRQIKVVSRLDKPLGEVTNQSNCTWTWLSGEEDSNDSMVWDGRRMAGSSFIPSWDKRPDFLRLLEYSQSTLGDFHNFPT